MITTPGILTNGTTRGASEDVALRNPSSRVAGIMLTSQSRESNEGDDALGQRVDSVKLATQSQQRLMTRTHQLTQAEAKQALHVMRLMKTSVVNHDC